MDTLSQISYFEVINCYILNFTPKFLQYRFWFTCILVGAFGTMDVSVYAQSINTEFGKNRVQYHDDFDNWWMYETENFITYWYGKGKRVAQSVIQLAEYDHDEIQNIIEHRINDKIEIIVYIDIADVKQSNLGSEDVFVSNHGKTKTIGSKMFVYFDGNTQNLRKQIRKGIAKVYLNSMFSGSSLQEIVQSNITLSIPTWYAEGITSYLSSYWDYLVDDELRDLFLREGDKYRNFEKLSEDHPGIAGHSFWYFLDRTYGKSTISNLLYLARINRRFEDSFMFVLGVSYDDLIVEWESFFAKHFDAEAEHFDLTNAANELDLSNKMHEPVARVALSPDGTELLYVRNEVGKIRVVLRDLETGKEMTVFKKGYKNILQETDYNYPLTSWHPDGHEVTVVYEHRDKIMLRKIDLGTGDYLDVLIPENFHRIYSVSFYSDKEYLFSASTDGHSDLYLFDVVGRKSTRLTEDYHNDLDAQLVQIDDQKGILFSSNRSSIYIEKEKLDTILPIDNFDLYFLPLEDDNREAFQLTATTEVSERYPRLIQNKYIAYLSSASGVTNLQAIDLDNLEQVATYTNLSRNIMRHDVNENKHVYTYYDDGAYKVYLDTIQWDAPIKPYYTHHVSTNLPKEDVGIGVLQNDTPEPKEEMKSGYLFQSKFNDPPNLTPIEVESDPLFTRSGRQSNQNTNGKMDKKVIEFVNERSIASRHRFKLVSFTTKADNSILFEGLESYTGEDKELLTAPVGLLFKGVVKDLFEDYSIEGGVRFPTSFNGSEYFFVFDDNRRLIDRRFALYRKAETNRDNNFVFPTQKIKRTSVLGMYRLKYPFDVYTSVRLTGSLRFDKLFYLHSNEFSTSVPAENEKRIMLKAEYVFDNTVDKDLNIKHGTRYKVYAEAINKFNFDFESLDQFDASTGFTTVVGFDARHYIPIMRHSVLALRSAGATSFGSDRILYYLGGVEGWAVPSFNEDIGVPPEKNFSYKAIAAHVRGFRHNIRNGTTFLLGNAELRVPIFQYFSRRKVGSSFLRNFQLTGFYDIGTAWHGTGPNSDENSFNTAEISQPPLYTVKLKYFRDPVVMGYGAGLRMSLFGYFLRFDYAWGIESRAIQDPRFYFSIGTDF